MIGMYKVDEQKSIRQSGLNTQIPVDMTFFNYYLNIYEQAEKEPEKSQPRL